MGAKEKILKDIHTLMTLKFKTPEEAFAYFDQDKDGALNRDEVKALLKEAGVGMFLRNLVASEMIKGYAKTGEDKITREEFKVATAALERGSEFF
jgi:Ca2+-binding EF-hand superfamily protein